MSQADPCKRLAAELPADGCRQVLARIEEARRAGRRVHVAIIALDETGAVYVDVRFTVDRGVGESVP
jgi:hypothetical protein